MKRISYAILSALVALALAGGILLAVGKPIGVLAVPRRATVTPGAQPGMKAPPAPHTPAGVHAGRVVLRLPYRGVVRSGAAKPSTVGMFDTGSQVHCPWFMGTDWHGNIYVLDPITPASSVLRCFDKGGQFREAWSPVSAWIGSGVSVTRDSYIWTGLEGDTENYSGLPIAVYRSGRKDPVVDWRYQLPDELQQKISSALKEHGLTWEQGWTVTRLEAGPDQVAMQFYGGAVGRGKNLVLWLRLRGDGSQVLEVRVARSTPHLALDGSLWEYQTDLNLSTYRWGKLWVWQRGKEKGEPLIDREKNPEPWPGTLLLGQVGPPSLQIGAQGQVYLDWLREVTPARERRFYVDGKVLSLPRLSYGGERALLVLDQQERVVAHLPWTPCSMYYANRWVSPLPDGSGFYRADLTEREARIWFHPLPK
jgi:hypothetical protein